MLIDIVITSVQESFINREINWQENCKIVNDTRGKYLQCKNGFIEVYLLPSVINEKIKY